MNLEHDPHPAPHRPLGAGDETSAEAAIQPALDANELLAALYDTLRRIAEAQLGRMPPGQTLQPTALVHEAYLRLASRAERTGERWTDRSHFLRHAARTMRDIMSEHVRVRIRRNRKLPAVGRAHSAASRVESLVEAASFDDAVGRLAEHDSRSHDVVVLRCLGGLSAAQIGGLLGIDERTVRRDWRFASAWLGKELDRGSGGGEGCKQQSSDLPPT